MRTKNQIDDEMDLECAACGGEFHKHDAFTHVLPGGMDKPEELTLCSDCEEEAEGDLEIKVSEMADADGPEVVAQWAKLVKWARERKVATFACDPLEQLVDQADVEQFFAALAALHGELAMKMGWENGFTGEYGAEINNALRRCGEIMDRLRSKVPPSAFELFVLAAGKAGVK